jgi:curved DNA-binding protein CbpA
MNNLAHYYEILGLKPNASPDEIKQAYRDLVKVWHPDRFASDSRLQGKAQERLKEINEAYEWLRNLGPSASRVSTPRSEAHKTNGDGAREQHEKPPQNQQASYSGSASNASSKSTESETTATPSAVTDD